MNTFKTHILAASNTFYEGECESLIVPTADGQYGILAGHCDIISAVVPGKMTYRVPGGENQIAAVSGGLVKVEDGGARRGAGAGRFSGAPRGDRRQPCAGSSGGS